MSLWPVKPPATLTPQVGEMSDLAPHGILPIQPAD